MNKLLQRPILLSIIWVSLCHLLFLWLLAINWHHTPKVKKEGKLVVQTVSLKKSSAVAEKSLSTPSISPSINQPAPAIVEELRIIAPPHLQEIQEPPKEVKPAEKTLKQAAANKEAQIKASKTEPKTKAQPKKKSEIKPVDKKGKEPAAKESAKPEKSNPQASQKEELLRQVRETIAKIDQKPHKTSSNTSLSLPTTLSSLAFERHQDSSSTENTGGSDLLSYEEELSLRLKAWLTLPEHGSVKIKLTLNSQGQFVQMQIIKAESEKNRRYIEKRIPELSFPCFGPSLPAEKQRIFSLTLNNQLN